MSINSLAAEHCVERAFHGVEPSRKANIVYDITSAMKDKRVVPLSNVDALSFKKPANLLLFKNPKEFVKLEKLQRNLKMASIALTIAAVAIFTIGFLAALFAPVAWPASVGIMILTGLVGGLVSMASMATGIAYTAKHLQYRNEVRKIADYILERKPAFENEIRPRFLVWC